MIDEKTLTNWVQRKPITILCHHCEKTIETGDRYKINHDLKGKIFFSCHTCLRKYHYKSQIEKNLENLIKITPKKYLKLPAKKISEEYFSKSGAFICGPVGVGKSALSIQIAQEAIKRGMGATTRITASRLMIKLKNFSDGQLEKKIDAFQNLDILIIEDLGVEQTTNFTYDCLYELINYRNEWEKFTIITSNMSLDKFDERISSRIVEMCVSVNLEGDDLRLKL